MSLLNIKDPLTVVLMDLLYQVLPASTFFIAEYLITFLEEWECNALIRDLEYEWDDGKVVVSKNFMMLFDLFPIYRKFLRLNFLLPMVSSINFGQWISKKQKTNRFLNIPLPMRKRLFSKQKPWVMNLLEIPLRSQKKFLTASTIEEALEKKRLEKSQPDVRLVELQKDLAYYRRSISSLVKWIEREERFNVGSFSSSLVSTPIESLSKKIAFLEKKIKAMTVKKDDPEKKEIVQSTTMYFEEKANSEEEAKEMALQKHLEGLRKQEQQQKAKKIAELQKQKEQQQKAKKIAAATKAITKKKK